MGISLSAAWGLQSWAALFVPGGRKKEAPGSGSGAKALHVSCVGGCRGVRACIRCGNAAGAGFVPARCAGRAKRRPAAAARASPEFLPKDAHTHCEGPGWVSARETRWRRGLFLCVRAKMKARRKLSTTGLRVTPRVGSRDLGRHGSNVRELVEVSGRAKRRPPGSGSGAACLEGAGVGVRIRAEERADAEFVPGRWAADKRGPRMRGGRELTGEGCRCRCCILLWNAVAWTFVPARGVVGYVRPRRGPRKLAAWGAPWAAFFVVRAKILAVGCAQLLQPVALHDRKRPPGSGGGGLSEFRVRLDAGGWSPHPGRRTRRVRSSFR